MLQKLDYYYYKPNHFFFIAGLKSRVKSSAIGLATISFMCTFLIVTLSMTVSTYRNMDHRFEFAFKMITQVIILVIFIKIANFNVR